jgi:hypothetical protein
MPSHRRRVLLTCFFLACTFALLVPRAARGDPRVGSDEDALDDRIAAGDIDEEDRIALRADRGVGTSDRHGQSWISVLGFVRQLLLGKQDIGGVVVVGLALDRMAAGPVHRVAYPGAAVGAASAIGAARAVPTSSLVGLVEARLESHPVLEPSLARACVDAALRASGLAEGEAQLEELVSRARSSAWLPETRMRAMRLWDDTSRTTLLASTNTTNLYDALAASFVLELRLTWRFDRLLYAGDEPTLERVRLELQAARSHLATRTLEALFAWERARVQALQAVEGSPEAVESNLRGAEARATLDVLTGGWFSTRGARAADRLAAAPPPASSP